MQNIFLKINKKKAKARNIREVTVWITINEDSEGYKL